MLPSRPTAHAADGRATMTVKPDGASLASKQSSKGGTDRRRALQLAGLGAAALTALSLHSAPAHAQVTLGWDKTFPRSALVVHEKVTFYNRLGINLVADLYV